LNFEETLTSSFRAEDLSFDTWVETKGCHPGTRFPVAANLANFNFAGIPTLGERTNLHLTFAAIEAPFELVDKAAA
jgi:hypothetical protein